MKPRLGRYRLLRKLGQGGMAQVYLARQAGVEGFSKKVVIKRMQPVEHDDGGLMQMFVSEAAIAAQLNHPNVVHVYDFAEAKGERFIVMEYVDGPSLKALLKLAQKSQRLLPVEHVLKIGSWVCEGLAYAHSLKHDRTHEPLGVVHRDVTPDNILLTRTGVVKIIDFGIARSTMQLHKTRPGQVKGKMAYIPPEQLLDEPVDRRADLYSLGLVLYEALTGVHPFQRDNQGAIIDAIIHAEVPRASSLRPELPVGLDAILARATARNKDERYASALELQAALDAELARLQPVFPPARLRELVATLDPPGPLEDDDETTTSDDLKLPTPADDEEPHTDVEVIAPPLPVRPAAVRTKTSPKVVVPAGPPPSPVASPRPEISEVTAEDTDAVTGTVTVATPPRGLPVVPLFALMVATGVVTWFVASWMSKRDEPVVVVAPRGVVAAAVDAGAPPAVEPVVDAGAVAVVVETPVDAGTAPAQVTFKSTPTSTLFIDGKKAGDTPVALALEIGPHRLRFENADAGLNKSLTLRVLGREAFEKEYVFEKARLTVEAPEGATLFLGRKSLGVAPAMPLELYEGTYRVRAFIDGELDVTKTIELKPGDTTERVGLE